MLSQEKTPSTRWFFSWPSNTRSEMFASQNLAYNISNTIVLSFLEKEMSMNSEVEIEVAYLVASIPAEAASVTPKRIRDIYLSDSEDLLTKLRLRQQGDAFELTKKVVVDPSNLSVQREYTVPLSSDEFELLRRAGGREVIKDRYTFPLAGHTAELDVFRGELEGFALIEFEFSSTDERDLFVPPACSGADVTQEDFIAGAFLAGRNYGDIEANLANYHYNPITRSLLVQ